jgi:diguanylate cyclase (GGDEF)-like protein
MRLGNITAIGETLYNMSINCILAQDYASAFNYLKVCIRIVEKMRLNDLRICNIAKLYGLLALASVRLSYEYDTSFYINTNRRFLAHIINSRTYKDEENRHKVFTGNDDELFLHYFVRGLLEEKNAKNEEALQFYKMAEVHCMKSVGNMFFSYVQLNVAMAGVYRKLGDEENALSMIDRAYAYATEKNYTDQMILLEAMRHGAEYNQQMVECGLERHTIDQFDDLLDKASMVVKNQDMSNHIEFISVWQNVLEIDNKTKEDLIKTAANSFMLNFNLDSFIHIKYDETSSEILFSEGPVELEQSDLKLLKAYFEKRKTGFVTAKIDKDYDDYGKILDIFGRDVLCSMVCTPYFEHEKLTNLFISCIYTKTSWNIENYRYFLNDSEANIYNLLLRQLLIAVDKIEYLNEIKHMNDALKQSSFTDYLTGLRNRNGLYDSFNRLLKKASRRKEALDLAVLYIDLDNFKYYNDTFGHDVGDLVLKEVAEILSITAKDSGFAIRYGGDEFLIILENAGKDEAMYKARFMLDTLISKNGYVDEINSFLGRRLEIKNEKKISCSIGVATAKNMTSDKDLSVLLKCADSSLYDVKHTTKNAIKFYEK